MELTLQDLIYRKARIGNLEAILDYSDREMTISNLSANWLDGVLSGRLTVRFPPNAMPDYHVVANWTDLRVGPMLREVLAPDWERNPLLAGELDLAWSGRDWTMATGQGRVHWTQEPAALTEKAPPMADLAAWATLLTDLQDAAVSFQAASGGWTVSAAQLRTSASDLELSGFIPVSHEGHSQSSSQREREGEAPTALLVEGATQAPTKGPMDLTLRFKTRALAEAARLAGMKQLDGSGRIEGRMTGSLQDPLFEGSLRLRKVRIRNQPVDSMASDITYRQRQLTFNHAVFRSGQGRYELRGLVQLPSSDSPLRFDLSAKIAGGDPKAVVAVFYKPLPIETAATGRLKVSGTPLEFTLQARLKVSGGGIYGQDLDEGETAFILTRREIRFDKSSGRRGKSRITGTGRIGFDGTFETSVVASHFSLGDITPLKPHLSGLEGSFSGSLTGQGELKNPQFHLNGRFEALRFRSQDLGPGPVSVRLEQKMVTVETDLRGLSGKATLLAADPYPYELSLDVREASLTDWISAAVPPKQPRPPILQIPVVATGSVSLQGRMTQIGRPSGKLDLEKLQIQAGELSLENDGPIRLTIVNGEVSLQSFRFKGPDTSLTFTGGLDLMNSYRLSIAGRTDLHIFRIFSRDLIGAKGAAVVGLEITDGWTNPKIRGGLTVKEAALRLSWLQHPIEIQTMTVAFSERQAVLENFEGTIFQGKTHATGQLGLQGFRISRYALMAETTKARLTGVPGLTAHLDASLIVQGQRAEKTDSPLSAKISGEIHVRKASYEKRVDWKTWVLDLIRPDQPAWIVPAAVGLTRLDLRLVGHEQIWIHNNLARVPLQLDLYIRGTLGNPIVLGRIETDEGRIFFQRNEFTLQSGTVDFISQERIRPVLDIRARTRTRVYSSATETSEYYTIDLALNGPIEKPVLTLSSDPPLRDQIEVLAILTFGRRPEDISQASAEIGTAEAATMVISEELQWLTTPFETITGADRFQVDLYASSTRATVEPRLTVEKRLWEDKVLVTYMKALDPSTEDIIRMEYLLGRNVSLIGERDELGSVGGDLKFRFEFR
jgi:autotransporter translocation and assembly factor TamB